MLVIPVVTGGWWDAGIHELSRRQKSHRGDNEVEMTIVEMTIKVRGGQRAGQFLWARIMKIS
jgi:hypothetical protein